MHIDLNGNTSLRSNHLTGINVTGGNANDITKGFYYINSDLVATNQPTADGEPAQRLQLI